MKRITTLVARLQTAGFLAAMVAASPWICREARATEFEVTAITVFREGGLVGKGKKTSPGQFLLEFHPSWPQLLKMRVVFSNPDWQTRPCPAGQTVFTRNGQAQPGKVIADASSYLTYEFPSVPRTAPQSFGARCERKDSWHTLYVVSGGATLRFLENATLGWDPQSTSLHGDTYEIESPMEGQSLSRTEPLRVRVRKTHWTSQSPMPPPVKVGLAVEKALSSQTGGTVGDIALPPNKTYTQWKALTTAWLLPNWSARGDALRCELQLTGYLGNVRTPEHEPGLYRLRIMYPLGLFADPSTAKPGSPWRSFQVPAKPVLQKVK